MTVECSHCNTICLARMVGKGMQIEYLALLLTYRELGEVDLRKPLGCVIQCRHGPWGQWQFTNNSS